MSGFRSSQDGSPAGFVYPLYLLYTMFQKDSTDTDDDDEVNVVITNAFSVVLKIMYVAWFLVIFLC